MAHFTARRDVGIEDGHKRTFLLGLVDSVEDVPGVASETVQARDHDLITRP